MLQINLITAISEKIKSNAKTANPLEESTRSINKSPAIKGTVYNPDLIGAIANMAQNARKKDIKKEILVQESFSMSRMQKKLENDLILFEYLKENFVQDNQKDQFDTILESVLELTIRLHQETDVTPRNISPAMELQETSNQKLDLYKNKFNNDIDKNFTRPLREGKINELYENSFRKLTTSLIEEGTSIDLDLINVYLPFEESTYNFIKSTLIPPTTDSRIVMYTESTKNTDLDMLSESVEEIFQELRKKIRLMSAVVGPTLFGKVTDSDDPVDKIAGVTIATDNDFNPIKDNGSCGIDPHDKEAQEDMEFEAEADVIHSDLEDEDEDDSIYDGISGDETLGSVGKVSDAISGLEANDDLDDLMLHAKESAEPTEHEVDLDVPEEFATGDIMLPGEEKAGENLEGLAEDPEDIDDFEHIKNMGEEDTLDTNTDDIDVKNKMQELEEEKITKD